MPVIQLFIPDNALSTAIAEQLQLADFGTVSVATDLEVVLEKKDTAAVLLDEALADKKSLKILIDAVDGEPKKRIFILGEIPKEWDANLITETFPKPLRLGHVLSRLQFYLQSAPRLNSMSLQFGPYRFEPQNRQIIVQNGGAVIRLTEKETALLEQLSQSAAAVTRDDLLATIWGYSSQIDTHTLETHIYQLRRKLDPEGTGINWLINEQGSYRLNRNDKPA